MTRTALLWGGSGQIGAAVWQRLVAEQWQVLAVSREARPPEDGGIRWLRGSLAEPPSLPGAVDAVISCGPLDAFARWLAEAPIASARVLAFGSTSVHVKQASTDAGERDVAARLRDAEAALLASAARTGAGAVILRPTLVYGAGRDATLTPLAQMARRLGRLALPRDALGLRQPVHVDDLADACVAALGAMDNGGAAFDLPGGERLPYAEMVRRVLACLSPPARLHLLPASLFRSLLAAARATGAASGLSDAMVERMRQDLVFDASPAQQALGYAPRPFRPDASMFC